jgi:REP element-mobilizing transposase RayT
MGSFTRLTYHIVFATKYRTRSIKNHVQERLYEYIGGTLRGKKGHLMRLNGKMAMAHLRSASIESKPFAGTSGIKKHITKQKHSRKSTLTSWNATALNFD